MIHLTSWPVIVVEFGLAVFCFLDVVLMREAQVRWMPRAVWALLLLCFPVAGSIGWIAAGRPWRHHKPIPDDIEPNEPTLPGDPFHHDTSPPDDVAPDDESPLRDQRRSRERPPRRKPPEDPPPRDRSAQHRSPWSQEPDDPPETEREPGERRRAPGPARDDHSGHGRGRWRWHGRPYSRSWRPGGPVGAGNTSAPRPDDVPPPTGPPPTGTPPTGTPPPGPTPRTPPVGLPMPRPDLAALDDARDPTTGLIGELFAVHEEHERTLRRWEEDLRRREQELRRHQSEERTEPPE